MEIQNFTFLGRKVEFAKNVLILVEISVKNTMVT